MFHDEEFREILDRLERGGTDAAEVIAVYKKGWKTRERKSFDKLCAKGCDPAKLLWHLVQVQWASGGLPPPKLPTARSGE